MKHFAHYDSEGQIIGFYADDTHKVIPEPHVEITLDDLSKHASNKQILCVDLAGDSPSLKKYTPPPPSLDELKAHALSEARQSASVYRRQIAEHVPEERAIAWVLKAAFGSAWALHEQNPTLADSALANAAQTGFSIEDEITGEDATDLRDRALANSALFFQATQVVEGMERLVEARIPAATTPEELETIIADLRTQEGAAAAKLTTLKGGAHA